MAKFTNFQQFYLYYLTEHQQPACRAFHYVGSSLVILILAGCIVSGQWQYSWGLLVAGYGCAWVGHFFIEHNKPATFSHPWYSLLADWVMFKDFLTGQLAKRLAAATSEKPVSQKPPV